MCSWRHNRKTIKDRCEIHPLRTKTMAQDSKKTSSKQNVEEEETWKRNGPYKIPIEKECWYLSWDREKMSHEMNMHLSLINLCVWTVLPFAVFVFSSCIQLAYVCVCDHVLFNNRSAMNVYCICMCCSLARTHASYSQLCASSKVRIWRWYYQCIMIIVVLFHYKIIRSTVNIILYWVNIPKRRLLSMTKYLTSRFEVVNLNNAFGIN